MLLKQPSPFDVLLVDAYDHVVDDQLLLLGSRGGRDGVEHDAGEVQEVRQRQGELDGPAVRSP